MSHRNARLTVEGRRLLVRRVRIEGMPVAHVAAMMGISRQCAHRWLRRFDVEGDGGLADRSSRPRSCPRRTPAPVEERVLVARAELRLGPDGLADAVGVPARTISRILARHQVPRLAECDPLTGARIRATKQTAVRYERERPGELVHIDVKKLRRIPPGGGWRAHGRANAGARARVGFDYVHSAVDDHSRFAYSEIHPDERGATAARFIERAAAAFAAAGIVQIAEILTDNHLSYRASAPVATALARLGATHRFIKPHCPWQNGKVERFRRTMLTEWAYRQPWTSNEERTQALATWLWKYNHTRPHRSLGGQPPTSRLSPT